MHSSSPKTYQRRRPEETLLYRSLAGNLNTFLDSLAAEGRTIPRHVEKELWAFLECGVLGYGFVRVKCDDCKNEQLVAFSCKKRGFCPSCGGKRMAETAEHLTKNIIPHVKVRQYVLSVPIPLRYWMASNKKLLAKVHRTFASAVENFYVAYARDGAKSGSITFVQRFGSALNLNVHFHMLQLEAIYEPRSTGKPKQRRCKAPSDRDIEALVETISKRVIKILRKSGYLMELDPDEAPVDPLFEEEPTYASCMSASVGHRIALGERQGQRVRFIGSGFGGACPESAARPSICTDRMSLTENGDIKYELKTAWRNGVTHVLLSPLELIEKLCSLIPLPNMHLVRYWGVLAPNAKMRKGVIPGKTRAEIKKEREQESEEKKKPKNSNWARLLMRVFAIDVSTCQLCGGDMRMISAIRDRRVIEIILTHLGLSPRPPPVAPSRSQTLFAS